MKSPAVKKRGIAVVSETVDGGGVSYNFRRIADALEPPACVRWVQRRRLNPELYQEKWLQRKWAKFVSHCPPTPFSWYSTDR